MEDMTINLHRDYSAINESLTTLFDSLGVRRVFTVPYVDGQQTDEHIKAVGMAAQQAGGLTQSLVTTAHHSKGKGWGTGDGATIGHQAESLKQTTIPRDDKNAAAVIRAAQRFINDVAFFLGDDDSTVKTAQSQLDLVKRTNGAGMSALHFGFLMQNLAAAPLQAVAQAHHKTKGGAPQLTPPRAAQTQDDEEETQQQQPTGAVQQ